MDVTIRQAEDEDLPKILELVRELNPDDPILPLEGARDIWQRIRSQSGHRILVARQGGDAVGCCVVVVVPNLTRSGRSFAVIENVVVEGRSRRRGIGRALLEAASHLARTENCYKVMFASSAKRTEAHRFYEACGFDGNSKRAFERRF